MKISALLEDSLNLTHEQKAKLLEMQQELIELGWTAKIVPSDNKLPDIVAMIAAKRSSPGKGMTDDELKAWINRERPGPADDPHYFQIFRKMIDKRVKKLSVTLRLTDELTWIDPFVVFNDETRAIGAVTYTTQEALEELATMK